MDDVEMDAGSSKPNTDSSRALRTWELNNRIEPLEGIYKYDAAEQGEIRAAKPWEKDPHYFKETKISAVALLKMVMHARSGGNLEVMGLLQGKVDSNKIIVIDSFALPVEGTETRVNAQSQAYEYMTTYTERCEQVGRHEKVVGWYHSHPGYGCWLSGIDVSTQAMNQQFQEPFVAVVVDPVRTMSAGKVELGAFRTYPAGYKPPDETPSDYQSIPMDKIEDFGVHCKQYYPLEVTYFKSLLDCLLLDSLWNTYWVSTLSGNPLISNASYVTYQLKDLEQKLQSINKGKLIQMTRHTESMVEKFSKTIKDTEKMSCEVRHAMMLQEIKAILFNQKFEKI